MSRKAADRLEAAGHDVVWAGDWAEDPGDDTVLARAFGEQRILVTLDKDFGELAIRLGSTHCGIMRIVNFSASQQAEACLSVLSAHGDELMSGAIVTAELGRVRIRSSERKTPQTTEQAELAPSSTERIGPKNDDSKSKRKSKQRKRR
jgi:predicted nuclease of predicted toxin-antitoxin system